MSSSPRTNPLMTEPSTPITIGITVTFIFHSFFSSLARSGYSSLFSLSFSFTLWSTGTAKSTIRQILFFLINTQSGRQAEIRRSISNSNPHRGLCVSFSWTEFGLCVYHLFVWPNCYNYSLLLACKPMLMTWRVKYFNFFLISNPEHFDKGLSDYSKYSASWVWY